MLDSREVGKAREGQQREKQRQVREYNKLNSALVSEWFSELSSARVCGGDVGMLTGIVRPRSPLMPCSIDHPTARPPLPPPPPSPHPAAGLLSLLEDTHRRARQENPAVQQRWADDLRKQFEPFDWTKMLE